MRILIATDWYKPVINGVVTSVVNLENELRALGHDVRVLTLSPTVHSQEEENVYYQRSISIHKIYPNARIIYSTSRKHVKEILEWKPEIIHTQCEFSSFVMAKRIAKVLDIPIVHTYHTVYEDYTHYFAPTAGMGKRIATLVSKGVCNRVERIIVPSEKVKKLLQNYGVEKPIDVIPSGIYLGHFLKTYSKEELDAKKQKLGIPLTDKICVSVGRLAKEKNETELLCYFKKAGFENCTYLIAGDGPYRESLEKQAQELGLQGKVIFCGMVHPKEVPFYYQLGDVFLCASNSETQGITYIEAMASGVPVLCRNDECLDSVIQDGIDGCCYDNYEQFAGYLRRLLGERAYAKRISENARIKVHEYSSETFAGRVLQTYSAAVRRRTETDVQPVLGRKIV